MTALTMGRGMAESRNTETLTFYVSNGISPNPDTLVDVESRTNLHVGIPGRVKFPTATVSESSAVGQSVASQSVIVSVAVGATPLVRTDHFCIVTGSAVDPGLIGRKFRIQGMPASGQVTAHRYPVEEVS